MAGIVLALFACQTVATAGDAPARIVNPTAASRKALQETVNVALATQVTLAEDALTRSSILTLEHKPQGSINSSPAQGRILVAPIQLQLLTNGSECFLVDQRDGRHYILAHTNCVPE